MSVHYKFKTELNYSTITFDGIHISVDDLKKAIIDQKRLAKSTDFDLQITNAQTKEVYEKDDDLIPKNTSVLVVRVPISGDKKKGNANGPVPGGTGFGGGFPNRHNRHLPAPQHQPQPSSVAKGIDLTMMEGSEEEKIQAMMNQSTADYDPSNYMRLRGQGQMGRVPNNYRCNKCNQNGHWIKDCPMLKSDANLALVKKSTGIPRIFMVNVDGPEVPGALLTPEGRYAVPAVDHAAYMDKTKVSEPPPPPKPKIPEELVCSLCQDLLTDALLVPCCANSYCDECIRNALLLDSADNECPGCHEKDVSPTSLIPNRFLRTAVNAFKNETGYSKPVKLEVKMTPMVDLTDAAKDRQKPRTLSVNLDDLPEDLFPHSPRKVDEEEEKKEEKEKEPDSDDLYNFNDMPIPPSLMGDPKKPTDQNIRTIGNQDVRRPLLFRSNSPQRRGDPRRPLGSGMPLPPGPPGHYKNREPPPPGFEDNNQGEKGDRRRNRYEDENRPPRHGGPPGPMGPMGGPMGMPPFPNMNMMPPGFMPPPLIGPPGMFPGPMGPMPPFMHPHFGPMGPGGLPPPHMFPGGRPPFHPDDRDRGSFRDRERDRDNRDRERDRDRDRDRERERERSSRHSYPPRRDRPPPREESSRREPAAGVIEDPLKEFERIMQEKDRLKELKQEIAAASATAVANPPKRSPSFSPPHPHRSPSPFAKRSSRSPANFSRSPSPKRSRVAPPPSSRRRESYSRSNSRSPRRQGRSRTPQPRVPSPTRRRSPRRAPPFSPSPPRFPPARKPEKQDYHESRSSRYESSSSRYHSSSSKPYDRDRDRDRDRQRDSRGDRGDREREYEKKYESSRKYVSSSSKKYDTRASGSGGRSSSHVHSQRHGSSRDRDGTNISHSGGPMMEQSVSNTGPPSLFDLNIKSPPHLFSNPEANLAFFRHESEQRDREKEKDTKIITTEILPIVTEVKEHHHQTPSTKHEEKKVKKEKKKHKKRAKDEKQEKEKVRKKKKSKEKSLEKSDDEESENPSGNTSPRASGEFLGLSDSMLALGNVEMPTEPLPPLMSTTISTAPILCDSTVKSPEHEKEEEDMIKKGLLLDKLEISGMTQILEPKQLEPLLGTLDVGEAFLDFDINFPKFDQHLKSEPEVRKASIPPSKWDNDEESLSLGEDLGEKTRITELDEPVKGKDVLASDSTTTLVTSEVLKRAESAIFEKKSSVVLPISSGKRRSPSPKPKSEKSGSSAKKDEKSKEKSHESQSKSKKTPESGTSSTGGHPPSAENPAKRSVRDRLGSKVDESPASVTLPSSSATTSSHRNSRETEKSITKTVQSEIRKSSRDTDRDRSRDQRRERDSGKKHSRSPISLQSVRRSRSRDRHREQDKSRQDSRREERPIIRDRSPRKDRQRSRERSPHQDRSRGRSPRRDEPRSHVRPRSRSKQRSPSPTKRRERSASRHRSGGSRRSGSRSRTKNETKPDEKDWKLPDKFKPISAQQVFDSFKSSETETTEGNVVIPVPLAMRKQKRINIKLTSTSKVEAESDSSSSAEGDEGGQVVNETEEDSKKRKKKLKRRKSNSTSESDSSEDEKKSKKKSKKKKKKKSKKKKK